MADVRSLAGGVDAAGVAGLQDVVGRADLLRRVQLARGDHRFEREHVVPGDARAGRPVAQVVRRQAGVVGRVLEHVRRPQRLVHHVHQVAIVQRVFDAVAEGQRPGRAPHARLRVAAHAVAAVHAAGVAQAAIEAVAARPVHQPGGDLGHVVVHRQPHGLARVGERRGPADADFQVVARRIGFDAQQIDAARLERADDRRAVLLDLLVRRFVEVLAFGVFLAVGRIDAHAAGDEMVGRHHVDAEQPRLRAVVLQAEPVVARLAEQAVVEILDVVGAAGDAR